jgi:hypothetical protein
VSVASLHVSVVHVIPSEHRAPLPTHAADALHVSVSVHHNPSLHARNGTAGCVQSPEPLQ